MKETKLIKGPSLLECLVIAGHDFRANLVKFPDTLMVNEDDYEDLVAEVNERFSFLGGSVLSVVEPPTILGCDVLINGELWTLEFLASHVDLPAYTRRYRCEIE